MIDKLPSLLFTSSTWPKVSSSMELLNFLRTNTNALSHTNNALAADIAIINPSGEGFTIEDTRLWQQQMQLGKIGSLKIGIIHLVETAASAPAIQALLKIVEEPPAHTQIILTSRNPNSLPNTLLSRCLILPIILKPETGNSPSITNSATEDKNQLTNNSNSQDTVEIANLIEAILASKPAILLKIAQKQASKAKQFLNSLITYLHQQSNWQDKNLLLLQWCLWGTQQLNTNAQPQLILEHVFLQAMQLKDVEEFEKK